MKASLIRDGTVPLLSLGYMCAPKNGAWTKHRDLYNPGHSPVKAKEYVHQESDGKLNVRGGAKTADHVDILGNWEMTVSGQMAMAERSYSWVMFSWMCSGLYRTLAKMSH